MDRADKQQLAEQMRTSAPRQAQPGISREEIERYPCSVRPVAVDVPGEPAVVVYLTVPEELQSGAPVVVNYHGGGFIRGRSDRDELFCRRLACTLRCLVVDVDYALSPDHPFPTAVNQARAAALWAKGQAESLGCDGEKVLLVGQSAGGNLVANVCMAEAGHPLIRPLCAVIAYAPMDMNTDPAEKPRSERDMPAQRARNYNALYCTPEQTCDPRVSPLFAPAYQLAAFPPTLVITAGDDSLAPEGERFAGNLARSGVEVTCKRFPNCVHGFFINRMDDWEEGIALIHRYLSGALHQTCRCQEHGCDSTKTKN